MPIARSHKSSWLSHIFGLLAFGALAFGALVAGRDTCMQRETAARGSYSRSTLAPITATGLASPSMRERSCKRSRRGFGSPRTAP